MAYRFFRVSTQNLNSAANELNRFLRTHSIDSVERHFVSQGEASFWLFCVEYQEQASGAVGAASEAAAASAGTRRKERVDYRELLNDDDFQVYVGLKQLRQEIADEEKLAIYLIFTNEQLAKIAETRPRTKEDLKKIEGLGQGRADKYGERVIQWLSKTQGDKHEASGGAVPENHGPKKPGTGDGQGAARKTSPA